MSNREVTDRFPKSVVRAYDQWVSSGREDDYRAFLDVLRASGDVLQTGIVSRDVAAALRKRFAWAAGLPEFEQLAADPAIQFKDRFPLGVVERYEAWAHSQDLSDLRAFTTAFSAARPILLQHIVSTDPVGALCSRFALATGIPEFEQTLHVLRSEVRWRAEQADSERRAAEAAATAEEARIARIPIDQLQHDINDARSQLHESRRAYDALWAEYNHVMDQVAAEQQEWLERTGSLSSKDCPDANEVSRHWEPRLGGARAEIASWEERYESLKAILEKKRG